jgi:hypothetical protein
MLAQYRIKIVGCCIQEIPRFARDDVCFARDDVLRGDDRGLLKQTLIFPISVVTFSPESI